MAGPAALAAAIVANEYFARKDGRREKIGSKKYIKDTLNMENLKVDSKEYGDKIGGPVGKVMAKGGAMPSKMKKLMPWEWF